MHNVSLVYKIGPSAQTKEYNFASNECLKILKNQTNNSLPLITGVSLKLKKKKKAQEILNIYVGEEVNLSNINIEKINEYDVDIEELNDMILNGYKKACIINYKKYDLLVVGLKNQDKVVKDYKSLNNNLIRIKDILNN